MKGSLYEVHILFILYTGINLKSYQNKIMVFHISQNIKQKRLLAVPENVSNCSEYIYINHFISFYEPHLGDSILMMIDAFSMTFLVMCLLDCFGSLFFCENKWKKEFRIRGSQWRQSIRNDHFSEVSWGVYHCSPDNVTYTSKTILMNWKFASWASSIKRNYRSVLQHFECPHTYIRGLFKFKGTVPNYFNVFIANKTKN
jgi:hypothetical protein